LTTVSLITGVLIALLGPISTLANGIVIAAIWKPVQTTMCCSIECNHWKHGDL
jgi:hypothetical protein